MFKYFPPVHSGSTNLLAALLLMLTLPVMAAKVELMDEVPHINNPAVAPHGVDRMQLQEQWRIGGDDDDVFFGLITHVETDESGNIYLLDRQQSQVFVFSPDGEFLRTLSREGDGPGEIRGPQGLALLADGTVALVQNSPGKIVRVTREGAPAGDIRPGDDDPAFRGFSILHEAKSRGGVFLVGGVSAFSEADPMVQSRTDFISSFDLEGNEIHRFYHHEHTFNFHEFVFNEFEVIPWFLRRSDLDARGNLYAAAERDEYAISVYSPTGTLLRVIHRDYDHVMRTKAQRDELIELFSMELRELPFPFEVQVGESAPDICWIQNGLRVAPDGTLWILSSQGIVDQSPGIMQTYDVFDPEGHFNHQVQVDCPGDAQRDYLFFVGNDRVLLVTGFIDGVKSVLGGGSNPDTDEEARPMEVICYTITGYEHVTIP